MDYETFEIKPPKNFEARTPWVRSELPDGTIVLRFQMCRPGSKVRPRATRGAQHRPSRERDE